MMPSRPLDKFERVAWESEYAVAILGNQDQSRFEFVELKGDCAKVQADLAERGLGFFYGVLGVTRGWPRCELAVPVDPGTIHALSAAYLRRLEDMDWMERAFRLPDTRS